MTPQPLDTRDGIRAFVTTSDQERSENWCVVCGHEFSVGEIVWYEPREHQMSCWAKGCYRKLTDRVPR